MEIGGGINATFNAVRLRVAIIEFTPWIEY